MKPITAKLTALLFSFSLIFAFCSKVPIEQNPNPGNSGKPGTPEPATAFVRFAAQINLVGQPYHSSSLHAEISVVNEKGEPVLTDKRLTLEIGEAVLTETLRLPVGKYRLTSFRLVHGGVITRFAAPIAGSAKAQMVQQPLAKSFEAKQSESALVPVEVLKVAEGERPGVFGYPAGAFDNNQSEMSPFATIKIRAKIKVGDVLFDDISASLMLVTFGANGERSTSFVSIKAGINEISLLKAASRYTLTVSKWGTSSELSLSRADLERDTIYTFRTERAPKTLRSETTLKLLNNQYQPDNKKVYVYDAGGKLTQVQYIYRQTDGSMLRGISDRITYQDGVVSNVSHYNDKNEKVWATSFTYDAHKRVAGIHHHQGNETTTGVVTYLGMPATSMGITYTVTKPGYHYEIRHSRSLQQGNVVEDGTSRAGYEVEHGRYDFDSQINPNFFLNLPDLHLTNQSPNNTTVYYKTFANGQYPEAAPYKSEYTYDADGYPKEVIRHFRSFKGGVGSHAYSTKTIFEYQ